MQRLSLTHDDGDRGVPVTAEESSRRRRSKPETVRKGVRGFAVAQNLRTARVRN